MNRKPDKKVPRAVLQPRKQGALEHIGELAAICPDAMSDKPALPKELSKDMTLFLCWD